MNLYLSKISVFTGILFLLSTFTVSAQRDSSVVLQDVIIESSRLHSVSSETGRSIVVISGETILDYPIQSLDELLRYLPNIEVQSRGAFGSQADISIRGATFNQVLIMIDGVRLNDPLTGHFNHHIPILPIEIKQIEIIKGGASVFFGPDAVGGVINIITKTFSEDLNADGLNVLAQQQYGEEEFIYSALSGYYKKNNWKIGGGTIYNETDGQAISDSVNNFYKQNTYSLFANYKANKLSLALRSSYDIRLFNAQFFYTNSTFDLSQEEVSRFWNQAQVGYQYNSKNKGVLDIAYQQTTDSFAFNPAFPANEHTTQYLNFQYNHYMTFNENFQLTLGGQADSRKIESNDRGNNQNRHYGIYAIGQYKVSESLILNGALRLDKDESFGLEVLPYFNVAYKANKWLLRASGSRNIRSADFTERFISTNLAFVSGGRNLGNPDLEAEKTWSFEAGFDRSLNNLPIKFSFSAFYRNSDNLIDYVVTPASQISNNSNLDLTADYRYAQNIFNVSTIGLETQIQASWTWDNSKLDLNLGYTLLHTDNSEDIVSTYISNHARNLITWNAIWKYKGVSVALNGLFKTRDVNAQEQEVAERIGRRLENYYTTTNIIIGYTFFKQLSLTLQVNNLFNESYADVIGAQLPSRWIIGGIKFKL